MYERFSANLADFLRGRPQRSEDGPSPTLRSPWKTPGFLFFAPYYASRNLDGVEQRRANFLGLVSAPFVFNSLMEGTLHRTNRHVGVRISDGADVLFDEFSARNPAYDEHPMFSTVIERQLHGRTWTFDLRTTLGFRGAAGDAQPLVILWAAIIVDAMLLAAFSLMSRAHRQALRLADTVTSELRSQTQQLTQSNMALERFAYAAAHDLKSPICAIGSLAEWIEEELPEGCETTVYKNLGLLGARVRRMDALVDGLIAYATVGVDSSVEGEVDVRQLVREVIEDVAAPRGFRMELAISVPEHTACADGVLLRQVLINLVGNAVKHHDRSRGEVVLSVVPAPDGVEFRVADDGPGIDSEFQARVFELFQTLATRDQREGSGIGLALVKKMVESHGSRVVLESGGERGADFRFCWPGRVVEVGESGVGLAA